MIRHAAGQIERPQVFHRYYRARCQGWAAAVSLAGLYVEDGSVEWTAPPSVVTK